MRLFLVLFASGAVLGDAGVRAADKSSGLNGWLLTRQGDMEAITSSATEGEEESGMELGASVWSMSSNCSPSKSGPSTDGTQKSLNLSFPM